MYREPPDQVNYKRNLKIYFSFLKKHKLAFVLVILTVLIVETLKIVDKFLFKIIIDEGTKFAAGEIVKAIFVKILLIVAIVYFTKLIISTLGNWLKLHLFNRIESDMMKELKLKFFNHIVGLSHNFHTSNKTGSLISRLIRGSGAIERFTDLIIFNFLPLILQIIIVGGALLFFDKTTALIVVIIVLSFITFSVLVQRKQLRQNIILNRT